MKHGFCCYHSRKLLRGILGRRHSWGSSIHLGCFSKIDGWVTYKRKKFISYNFESWEFNVSVPVDLTVCFLAAHLVYGTDATLRPHPQDH